VASRFVPRINLDAAATPHAKWLQERSLSQESEIGELRSWRDQFEKQNSAGARATTNVNQQAADAIQRLANAADNGYLLIDVDAAAGAGASVSFVGTATTGVLTLITGTSPTTTGHGVLITLTNIGWTDESVPACQLTPANEAAAYTLQWALRSGPSVQLDFDRTKNIVASTTYRWNYTLQPLVY
jgi:hypothetical protein